MSKRMTRVLSLILTLVMFVSVSTPAFAWGGGDLGSGWDREIGEDEVREFDGPVVEDEEALDYFHTIDNETLLEVTVEAPMGALPMQAELRAEPVEIEDVREAVESVVEGEANIVLAMDISFWMNGIEIEPEQPVSVKIGAPELADRTNLILVHIPDAAEPETIDLIDDENLGFALGTTEIAFKANSFSVYAIVDPADDGPARDTYYFEKADGNPFLFYNTAGDQVDNQIIKDGEYLEDVGLPTILANQTFLGWFLYDKDSNTFGEKITFGEARTVEEGANHTFYVRPKYDTVVYLTFYNNAEGSIIKDRVQVIVTSGENVTYDLTTEDATPPNGNLAFVGWTETLGGEEPIAEATAKAYPVTQNQNFFPVFKSSHWLSYWTAAPGTGATYIAPSHVLVGHKASETITTEVPKVKGYTFRYWTTVDQSGNWTKVEGQDKWVYAVPENDPPEFNADQELSADTTLYAVWENAQSSYRVIIWHQSIDDDKNATEKTYEQFSQDLRQEAATETVYTTAADRTAPTGFVYNAEKSDTSAVVSADGTTILNVYFDRKLITMNFSGYKYTQITDTSGWYNYGYAYYQDANGNWQQGQFRYRNGSWQQRYSSSWDGTQAPYLREDASQTFTGLYGQPLSKYEYTWPTGTWRYANSEGGTTGMSYLGEFILPEGVADSTGTVINFTSSEGTMNKIDFYLQNVDGSTYPTTPNDTGYVAQASAGSTFYFSEKYDGFYVAAYRLYTEDAQGNRTYYKLGDSFTLYYISNNYPYRTNAATATVYNDWIPCKDGDSTAMQSFIRDNEGAFGTSYDSNYWGYYTTGDLYSIDHRFNLEIRYARKSYTFKYLDSIDGSEVLASAKVYYQAPLTPYKPTAEQEAGLVSQTPGKEFGGNWYKDQGCQTGFDWNATMPNADYQAYAGWEDVWYWIKVDPDGGVINDETTGSTWFWNIYGESVTEYNFVKREYVESDTGTYYYHNHQLPHPMNMTWEETEAARAEDPSYAYYTTDASKSTDGGMKYAYVENAYDLLGWYVVDMETGETTDELFNFDTPTTSNIWIRAKWHRNGDFPIYYSAEGVDKTGAELLDDNGDRITGANAPTDVARYDDGANSAMLMACDPPQGYVFLGWYYAGKVYDPGEKFIVDAAQANEEGAIVIYAAYEKIDSVPVRVTHITWYDNFTEDPVEGTNYKTDDELQINAAVPIESSTLFTRYGYKFLGWARVDTTDSQGNPIADYELAPRELGRDDLYLTWHEADETHQDGYYTVNYNGEDKEVTEVAADEIFPYHDMYAVWGQEYFYVFHSSDCTVEKIAMPISADTKYDLTSLVKGDYLYGGYYSDYGKKGDYDIANPAEFTSAVPNSTAYVGGIGPWKAANAIKGEGAKGTEMTPEVGKTYFLKEVPSAFLKSLLYVIYDANNVEKKNLIVHNYLLADVDDNNYSEIGMYANNLTTGDRIKLAVSYTIVDTLNTRTDKITAKDFFGAEKGYVAVWKPDLATGDFDFVPFFVTPDGVTVEGANVRYITWGDGTYQEWKTPGVTFKIEANENIIDPGQIQKAARS